MEPRFVSQLDALAGWRQGLDRPLAEFSRFLREHDLIDAAGSETADAMRQRLAADRLVVAFVAEFSRGKSELINAIFFGDTGRRILPATPGRTTMCPVELGWENAEPPLLALLPIETRLEPATLAELRAEPGRWQRMRLEPGAPDRLAEALLEVVRTKPVSVAQARALGFWRDDAPADNPPLIAPDTVEVPAWRHAAINYPHPLLRRGLVVLDTPGLNAVGAEPELTLSLLPAAHAVVFLLGADTGVSKSDLALWRDHLEGQPMARYIALNKIDALADPLLSAQAVLAQIERQRLSSAQQLGVPAEQVFALSARQALSARIAGQARAVADSGVPALEQALVSQLLPQRRQVLSQVVCEGVHGLQAQAARRVAAQRRHVAEQMFELRALRGKSGGKVLSMLSRVDAETEEFERCTMRLSALRLVQARMLRDALRWLGSERLRDEVGRMQREIAGTMFNLGAKKSFAALCARLRALVRQAQAQVSELHEMLSASYRELNAEYGFALALDAAPSLQRTLHDLALIERSYGRYLGLSNALRLADPRFFEQFRRMLVTKLRVVFEAAASETELWTRAASAQADSQLREHRRSFKRRHESLERIRVAAGELEERIAELELQEQRWQHLQARAEALAQGLLLAASREPAPAPAPASGNDREPPTLTLVVTHAA